MYLDDTAHILGSTEFFAICNLEQRRMLSFASERVKLEEGETLFISGEVVDGAYVLVSGELMSKQLSGSNADPIVISEPGTIIAELALITSHPRRSTLICKSEVELLMVPRAAFTKLMQQFPEIASYARELVRTNIATYVNAIDEAKPKLTAKGSDFNPNSQ